MNPEYEHQVKSLNSVFALKELSILYQKLKHAPGST